MASLSVEIGDRRPLTLAHAMNPLLPRDLLTARLMSGMRVGSPRGDDRTRVP